MIAEAAIHAVHELTVHERGTVAVRGTVGEQAGAPVVLVLCDRDAFACAGCSECCGWKQAENCHNQQEC